ncbi:MAG: very short patch repair endonuclease [archaeon]
MDKYSKKKRSEIMSKIKSKDTAPELKVRSYLHYKGIRFRKNCKDITGNPDICIRKYKIAIFVNGCFWHGHKNCKKFTMPKTNYHFWKSKIDSNIKRDRINLNILAKKEWVSIIVWECQLESSFKHTMNKLIYEIERQKSYVKNQSN